MEINKGTAGIDLLCSLTDPTKTTADTCWHCRNSTVTCCQSQSCLHRASPYIDEKGKWINSWIWAASKNHNGLDLAIDIMMQGNWFICATQTKATQPDKEIKFSGMFTEW